MAGTVLGVGIFCALGLLSGLTISASEIAVSQVKLQTAADTIAVAASDGLQGLNAGLPCESAEDLAEIAMVQLRQCSILGQSVHISLLTKSLGIVLNAEAIAEPMQ